MSKTKKVLKDGPAEGIAVEEVCANGVEKIGTCVQTAMVAQAAETVSATSTMVMQPKPMDSTKRDEPAEPAASLVCPHGVGRSVCRICNGIKWDGPAEGIATLQTRVADLEDLILFLHRQGKQDEDGDMHWKFCLSKHHSSMESALRNWRENDHKQRSSAEPASPVVATDCTCKGRTTFENYSHEITCAVRKPMDESKPVAWSYQSWVDIGGPRDYWMLSEIRATADLKATKAHPSGRGEWPLHNVRPLYLREQLSAHPSPLPVGGLSIEIRKQLWLAHGCGFNYLYGDDGEMQCNRSPFIDFKRDDEAVILAGIDKHNAARFAESQRKEATK